MNSIIEIIAVTAKDYSGITMHQFVRSPKHHETLINLAEVLADSQRPSDDHRLVCPKTMLFLDAEDLLIATGLVLKETPGKAPEAVSQGLQTVTDVGESRDVNMSERTILNNLQLRADHEYPTAFLLLPMGKKSGEPTTLMDHLSRLQAKAERVVFNKFQLHCFCECRFRDEDGQMQPRWHPPDKKG